MSEPASPSPRNPSPVDSTGPEPVGEHQYGLLVHGTGPLQSGMLEGVLRSSRNAVEALGPESRVEAVIQGPGVAMLAAGSDSGAAIAEAASAGISILACGNSLRSAGIDATDLVPGVSVVPAAIAHLARRQWDGWAYVRL